MWCDNKQYNAMHNNTTQQYLEIAAFGLIAWVVS